MTTATKPAENVSKALQLAEQSGVTYNLDGFPEDRFNRLIPTQTIAMPSDLLVPVVQVVRLDPADSTGKSPDHYKSNDVPGGHRALTARGLNKVANAAGISFFDERRIDDGSDPDVIGVGVMASMLLPTGQRITAPGTQMINIKTWFGSQTSPAELAKFRKQFYAHVATRARNRAIRGILSMRASYPDRDINKPFACVSYAPNMNHPEVRVRILDAMAPAIKAVYGPEDSRQITAGSSTIQVDEAPDDESTDGDFTTVQTNGHSKVDKSTGEIVSEEPDWFGEEAAHAKGNLVERLKAAHAEAPDGGPLLAEQKAQVKALLTGLATEEVLHVLGAAFGYAPPAQGPALSGVTAGHAAAILEVASEVSADEFRRQWQEAAS
jgi:hypothetical protein